MTEPLNKAPAGAPSRAPLTSPGLDDGRAGIRFPDLTDDPIGRTTLAWPEITEMRTAHAIRRVLDQGTDRLPIRVTDRLASARQQALMKVLETPDPITVRRPVTAVPRSGTTAPLRWQLGALAVSAMLMAGVVALVDAMKEDQSVEELAEVDSALLADELPLDAYVDRGFSVYMVNTRLPQTQTVSFNSSR